ncbi:MAG TPA: flagellar export protein FliJ [Kineosporiaceae bacterium]|nr:flagellar export protein FliJ [Kineosporiaceae bacterium]
MKPFRLTTLERLRDRELETRAQELNTAAATRDQAVVEHDRLVGQLARGSAAVGLGTWTGADLDLANNYRQVLRQSILDQTEQIAALEQELARARTAWLSTRARLRAVQALHDRHRVELRAEQVRRDQRELDEHAGTRRPSVRDLGADTEVGAR